MAVIKQDDGLWLVDISDGKSSLTGKRIRLPVKELLPRTHIIPNMYRDSLKMLICLQLPFKM